MFHVVKLTAISENPLHEIQCYDPKLSSNYNLGKDLKKDKRMINW